MAEEDRQIYLQRAAQLRDRARTARFANAALLSLAMKYERLAAARLEDKNSVCRVV
jgi:hypothetical protein